MGISVDLEKYTKEISMWFCYLLKVWIENHTQFYRFWINQWSVLQRLTHSTIADNPNKIVISMEQKPFYQKTSNELLWFESTDLFKMFKNYSFLELFLFEEEKNNKLKRAFWDLI